MSAISTLGVRQPIAKSRRTASLAIVTPAIGLFGCLVAIILLETGTPWATVTVAAWTTGLATLGPLVLVVTDPHDPIVTYQFAGVGFLMLAILFVVARRSRLGDIHWVLCGLFMGIWTAVGLLLLMPVLSR